MDSGPSAQCWREIAGISLEDALRKPVRTVRDPPRWFRAQLRQALAVALRERHRKPEAAWKLFVLTPRMLLRPTEANGEEGKNEFLRRFRLFQQGAWLELLRESELEDAPKRKQRTEEEAAEHWREQAASKIKIREISRARACLTSKGIAPGTEETFRKLADPSTRPERLFEPLPDGVLNYRPADPIKLQKHHIAAALRGADSGSAPDLAGMRYEHLRVLLEDETVWTMFCDLAQDIARAKVPAEVMQALRLGRMTALNKEEGKVRGIVAGSVLRRVVCRAVALQFADKFLDATAPYQYALQTRAGIDALVHALRFLVDRDDDTVVVSLDGAFDHVKRAAIFNKLLADPGLRPLIPLVGALYGSTSRFLWTDDNGIEHVIEQGEGGEQGCPLMPALFALAQHEALVTANTELQEDEYIFRSSDDLYVITKRARAEAAFKTVAQHVENKAV